MNISGSIQRRMRMKDGLRELYSDFFKKGAFYISTLLVERHLTEIHDSIGGIPWDSLLELHSNEDNTYWRTQLREFFRCSDDIRDLNENLRGAIYLLETIDVGKTGRKRADYQALYPSLILDTYGKNQNVSQVYPYDSTAGAGTVRYDRIRKTALDILIDGILAKNNENHYIDYDFESDGARYVMEELLYLVEYSHDKEVLGLTRKIFRRLQSYSLSGALSDAKGILLDAVENNPIGNPSNLTQLETRVITTTGPYCAVIAKAIPATSTYILYIDGQLTDIKTKPFFDKQFDRVENGEDKFKLYNREQLEGHNVVICAGPEPEALETEVYSEDGYDVARAKPQSYCKSYSLRIDGYSLDTSKHPYFKKYEEGSFNGRKVEILAERDLNDLFLVVEAARKYGVNNNLLLSFTDPQRNLLTNNYSLLILANASLDVIKRVSPDNYRKIEIEIHGGRKAQPNTDKRLWPLACIFTLQEFF